MSKSRARRLYRKHINKSQKLKALAVHRYAHAPAIFVYYLNLWMRSERRAEMLARMV